MQGPPRAAASAAQKVDADQQVHCSRHKQDKIPSAAVGQLDARKTRWIDHDASGESPLGLVFAAEINDDEMQRERAYGKIETAEPERGEDENKAEDYAGKR